MNRSLFAACLALFLCVAPLSSRSQVDDHVAVLHTLHAESMSEQAPGISVTDADGKPFVLAAYLGRPVVVHFWATWCEPCRHELPTLAAASRRLADSDLQFIAISIDRDVPVETVRALAHDYDLPFPVALASTGNVSERYWAMGIPVTYFIDRRGVLIQRFRGSCDWGSATGQHALDELASSPRVPP